MTQDCTQSIYPWLRGRVEPGSQLRRKSGNRTARMPLQAWNRLKAECGYVIDAHIAAREATRYALAPTVQYASDLLALLSKIQNAATAASTAERMAGRKAVAPLCLKILRVSKSQLA